MGGCGWLFVCLWFVWGVFGRVAGVWLWVGLLVVVLAFWCVLVLGLFSCIEEAFIPLKMAF